MFSTAGQKFLLLGFVVLMLAIPVGSYFLSQRMQVQISQEQNEQRAITTLPSPSPRLNPVEELKQQSLSKIPEPSPAAQVTTPVSFGPTLSLKITLEARPAQNQSARLFVGIAEGKPTSKPTYILSFTIDVPASGVFEGLSLAGLTQGNTYSAYLKNSSHIATSSAFIMSPSVSTLNNNQPLKLLAGDLNDDNLINTADFAIANNAFGTSSSDKNYNANTDFNLDGKINSIDIAFIIKNFGKSGDSGVWVSPVPISGSPSGVNPQESTPAGSASGYWIWMPKY